MSTDYSKGFSDYWFLSHVDIKVPSEHIQNGMRFDAEVQMKHFYTLPIGTLNEKGQANENEVGTISVFLQSFDDATPNPYLDTLICEWRGKELETLMMCPRGARDTPIPSYSACRSNGKRQLLRKEANQTQPEFQNVYDVLFHNHFQKENLNYTDINLGLHSDNWKDTEAKDWDAWIQEKSKQMTMEEKLYQQLRKESEAQGTSGLRSNRTVDYDNVHEQFRRKLADRSPWSDYWAMLGCKTEVSFASAPKQRCPCRHKCLTKSLSSAHSTIFGIKVVSQFHLATGRTKKDHVQASITGE